MKTEIWFYFKNKDSLMIEREGEWTIEDMVQFLKGDGKWFVFPKGKYQPDSVFIRESDVMYITVENLPEEEYWPNR